MRKCTETEWNRGNNRQVTNKIIYGGSKNERSVLCFISGVQLMCMGVLGEYIGKIYMETKARPRYIISERTYTEIE